MTPDEIRILRAHLGLTQRELAHRLGVTEETVNRWEKDHRTPSPLALRALKNLGRVKIARE